MQLLRRSLRLLLILCALPLAQSAFSQASPADTELGLGVQAYKQARYEEAIQHFEKAVAADPSNVKARLYVATAFAQQYIPGAETPENKDLADRAIHEYQRVLDLDPAQVSAVKGIAYLDLQMKKFNDAKNFYLKATELDSSDPENYYAIGVIDWTQAYQRRMQLRTSLKLPPQQSLIKSVHCPPLRDVNLPLVEDGIQMLEQALDHRPEYDDAMAYMNLMYRERADIQCGNAAANKADLRTADEWVDKTMATKKAKAERQRAPKDGSSQPPGPGTTGYQPHPQH